MAKHRGSAFALLLAFTFIIALAVNTFAATEEIPELYIPEKSYFKMEFDLPEKVDSDSEFTGNLYVRKVYGAFSEGGITSLSGTFSYNNSLFEIIPSTYSANGFSAEISAGGFNIRFDTPISSDRLTELSLSITVKALHVTDEENESIDRVYICADYVSAVGDETYSGIGGIGYTEFVFAAGDTSSEPSEEESSDTMSADEFSTYSEQSYPEYSEYYPEESDYEVSETSYEEPSYPPDLPDADERFASFLSSYRLNENGEYILGFMPGISEYELIIAYPEITIFHYNAAAIQTGFVSTDDVLLFFADDGSLYKRLICVIKGDLNGDGKISSSDYIALRLHILKRKALTSAEFIAADINEDGRITPLDYVSLRMFLLKKTDIYG